MDFRTGTGQNRGHGQDALPPVAPHDHVLAGMSGDPIFASATSSGFLPTAPGSVRPALDLSLAPPQPSHHPAQQHLHHHHHHTQRLPATMSHLTPHQPLDRAPVAAAAGAAISPEAHPRSHPYAAATATGAGSLAGLAAFDALSPSVDASFDPALAAAAAAAAATAQYPARSAAVGQPAHYAGSNSTAMGVGFEHQQQHTYQQQQQQYRAQPQQYSNSNQQTQQQYHQYAQQQQYARPTGFAHQQPQQTHAHQQQLQVQVPVTSATASSSSSLEWAFPSVHTLGPAQPQQQSQYHHYPAGDRRRLHPQQPYDARRQQQQQQQQQQHVALHAPSRAAPPLASVPAAAPEYIQQQQQQQSSDAWQFLIPLQQQQHQRHGQLPQQNYNSPTVGMSAQLDSFSLTPSAQQTSFDLLSSGGGSHHATANDQFQRQFSHDAASASASAYDQLAPILTPTTSSFASSSAQGLAAAIIPPLPPVPQHIVPSQLGDSGGAVPPSHFIQSPPTGSIQMQQLPGGGGGSGALPDFAGASSFAARSIGLMDFRSAPVRAAGARGSTTGRTLSDGGDAATAAALMASPLALSIDARSGESAAALSASSSPSMLIPTPTLPSRRPAARVSPARRALAGEDGPAPPVKHKTYFVFGDHSFRLMKRYLLVQEGKIPRPPKQLKYPSQREIDESLTLDRRPPMSKKRWSRLQGNLVLVAKTDVQIPAVLSAAIVPSTPPAAALRQHAPTNLLHGSADDDDGDEDGDGDDDADMDELDMDAHAHTPPTPTAVPSPALAIAPDMLALMDAYHVVWGSGKQDSRVILPRSEWTAVFRSAHLGVAHVAGCPAAPTPAPGATGDADGAPSSPALAVPAPIATATTTPCACPATSHRSLRDTYNAIKLHFQVRRSRCGMTLANVRRMFGKCSCCVRSYMPSAVADMVGPDMGGAGGDAWSSVYTVPSAAEAFGTSASGTGYMAPNGGGGIVSAAGSPQLLQQQHEMAAMGMGMAGMGAGRPSSHHQYFDAYPLEEVRSRSAE
ncbi:hypothetical protein H9P43_000865 [Blastocladiella emersonii ATCC 22665]|nr:hypothetical protein H9P43_000865 [Blastocladiella emersonii ATCC 22665]